MRNKRLIWALCLIGLSALLTAGGFFFYFHIYRVEPAFSHVTYEYGQHISADIGDYLEGSDWSVHLGELDLSRVDENHIGIYEAFVYHGDREYVYSIEIRDTRAPELTFREGPIYLAKDREYLVESVIAGIDDEDVHAGAYFEQDGLLLEKITLKQPGRNTLRLVARDCSGNETVQEISVFVDSAPEIAGVQRYYLVPDSQPDYRIAVKATDDADGELTDRVRVDDSAVDLSEEGEYILRYEVEDSYGLKTVAETTVMVAKAADIQKLIGARLIDYRSDVIEGAFNIYDGGASAEENLDLALEQARPTLVHLYHEVGRGGYSSGSGYIMEITEDKIYICTNRHVVTQYEKWDVYFFDGTKVPGKALGAASGYDVGVAVVETEDVPEELLHRLRTVHIDKTYWLALDEEPIELGLKRLDRAGGTLHVAKGELIKVKQAFDWYERLEHTEVTVELVHGDSGSAVVDGYGNLICMAYAYSTEPIRYWCVPLDEILACYEEITGRMPYVY